MVRLKVNSGNVSMLRAEISIPYGAIKRRNWGYYSDDERCISIPYGAIKRLSNDFSSYEQFDFNSLWCD